MKRAALRAARPIVLTLADYGVVDIGAVLSGSIAGGGAGSVTSGATEGSAAGGGLQAASASVTIATQPAAASLRLIM